MSPTQLTEHGFKAVPTPPENFWERLPAFLSAQKPAALLRSNGHRPLHPVFENLAAWGGLPVKAENLKKLYRSWGEKPAWLLGYLGYDLKNHFEKLTSQNPDLSGLPELWFFAPQNLIIQIESGCFHKGPLSWDEVLAGVSSAPALPQNAPVELTCGVSYEEYETAFNRLQKHIKRGDIYEVNYCIPFAGKVPAGFSDAALYTALNQRTQAPFSAWLSAEKFSIASASPERYLLKQGDELVSQPIKGTAPRLENPEADRLAARHLRESEKETSENVMITDLVRNDLSRVAQRGSVEVEELFGVYSFRTVHQLISTVRARLKADETWAGAVAASFPMGSMTGAPKVRAMQLIEEVENFKRGPYSGALGYLTPWGDLDFNVLIRSLFHHRPTGNLMAGVGSALTYLAQSQAEYEECLLKVEALKGALS